jgi:hypothetical protein
MTDTVDKVGDEIGFDLFRLLPVGRAQRAP